MLTLINLNIVSPEAQLFSGEASMVIATGKLGELGIAPGHTPLLTPLKPGPIRIKLLSGDDELFYVSGGMLEIQPNTVTILADTAVRADDLDESEALAAKERAEKSLTSKQSDKDYSMVLSELAEAAARLRVIHELKHLRQR